MKAAIVAILAGLAASDGLRAEEAAPVAASRPAGNPILPGNAADPHMALFGHRYYLYGTHEGAGLNEFAAWSSPDMVNWKSEGVILRFPDLRWQEKVDDDAWAPGIASRNGKYYFYFCAHSRIGVAVADSPVGPFKDALGKPLIPFRQDLSAIDPMAFIDDDGQAYLYWGAVQGEGKHLFVRKLNADMISFAGPEQAILTTDGVHIEGSFVVKRDGRYYFMWSAGGWNVKRGPDEYRAEYAVGDSPLGPFHRGQNNPMLSADRRIGVVAPGHHSVLQFPGTDDWYIIYHVLVHGWQRRVWIDRLRFAADGSIEKVVPTREGVQPRPVPLAVTADGGGPFKSSQDIQLTASLEWPAESVARIEFFANGRKICQLDGATERFTFKNVSAGFYRVYARAVSSTGATTTSEPICFDVQSLSSAAVAQEAKLAPVKIIFDTDMAEDVDDVGAIALLHALADRGEAEILACMISSRNEWTGPCIDAINTWYGRPNIPIGNVGTFQHGYPNSIDDKPTPSKYVEAVARAFPHKLVKSSDAMPAVKLYRKILAAQPDKSVTIVTVGFLSNLKDLLNSTKDEASDLSGEDLVKKKVKQWVCMGGGFVQARTGEYNLAIDTVSSVRAVNDWPTPAVFSGFEIGSKIGTGARLRQTDDPSPIKAGYQHYNGLSNRCSWDQTAVLFAVRGARDYWRLSETGQCIMHAGVPQGWSEWLASPKHQQRYLIEKMPPAELGEVIEDLMIAPPKRAASKKTN